MGPYRTVILSGMELAWSSAPVQTQARIGKRRQQIIISAEKKKFERSTIVGQGSEKPYHLSESHSCCLPSASSPRARVPPARGFRKLREPGCTSVGQGGGALRQSDTRETPPQAPPL